MFMQLQFQLRKLSLQLIYRVFAFSVLEFQFVVF